MRLRCFFICFIACLICRDAFPQKFLALDKSGRIKRVHFYVGDDITFLPEDYNHFISGKIEAFGDSGIKVSGKNYLLSEIVKVRVYRRDGMRYLLLSGATVLPVAAVYFLGVGAVNSMINREYPVFTESQLKMSGAFLLLAPVCYRLTYRNFKIGKKHPLKIMDVHL